MTGHILLIADGRSPTALSWIKNIQALGFQVSLISSFPCNKPEGMQSFHILPIALSQYSAGSGSSQEGQAHERGKLMIKRFSPILRKLRYILGPLSLYRFASTYQKLVSDIAPDVVHALRIPYEGMLGSFTPRGIPFLVAIWGNDLTLHARGSWLMRHFTRRCLSRTDGLTADTQRDIRLARKWGLHPNAPDLCVPGSGGLDLEAINNASEYDNSYNIPPESTWIVNPRGLRPGSVHQDVFFSAIPEVLDENPNISFICPSLKGQPQVKVWMAQFNITSNTFLLPKLPQSQLWALFKKSTLFISPSSHDGTPNTLLEAMACGCFPILGDIESLREWIDHGHNGLLVDPQDPQALTQAILTALSQPDLLAKAAKRNHQIIENRAAKNQTLPKIDDFYRHFIR